MGKELSVYKQMTISTADCLNALKREIGLKTTCIPFAVKLIAALKELTLATTQEELNAANVLLSGLQTLMLGGITAEDYDKIDFVKRGKTIVPSARVEAFYRAAARKGYRITDKIVAVPNEDFGTTYFEEVFESGDIVLVLKDERKNTDRTVTAGRLVDKYFKAFICRLDVHDIKNFQRVAMCDCEISIDDMLQIAATSEQGLYKSKWVSYKDGYGREKKKKVITDELNSDTFWAKWTGEMVNKTIIRRALKRIKETLPELQDVIYAFEQDDYQETEATNDKKTVIDIPMDDTQNIDLYNLTKEQQEESLELYEIYKANPKLAEDKFAQIEEKIKNNVPAHKIINEDYASLIVLKRSKAKWNKIGGYFNEES